MTTPIKKSSSPDLNHRYWQARLLHSILSGMTPEMLVQEGRLTLLGNGVAENNHWLKLLNSDRQVWAASVPVEAMVQAMLPVNAARFHHLNVPAMSDAMAATERELTETFDAQPPRRSSAMTLLPRFEETLGLTLEQANETLASFKTIYAMAFPDWEEPIAALKSGSELDEALHALHAGKTPKAWTFEPEPPPAADTALSVERESQPIDSYWLARLVCACHDGIRMHMILTDDGNLTAFGKGIAQSGIFHFINDGSYWKFGEPLVDHVMRQLFAEAGEAYQPMTIPLSPHTTDMMRRDHCEFWLEPGIEEARNIIQAHRDAVLEKHPDMKGWLEHLPECTLDHLVVKHYQNCEQQGWDLPDLTGASSPTQVDPAAEYWMARFFEEARRGMTERTFFTPGNDPNAFAMAFKDGLLRLELLAQPQLWHASERAPHRVIRNLYFLLGIGNVLELDATEDALKTHVTDARDDHNIHPLSPAQTVPLMQGLPIYGDNIHRVIGETIDRLAQENASRVHSDADQLREDYLGMTRVELDEHVYAFFRSWDRCPKPRSAELPVQGPEASEPAMEQGGMLRAADRRQAYAELEKRSRGNQKLQFDDLLQRVEQNGHEGFEPTPLAVQLYRQGLLFETFRAERWNEPAAGIAALNWLQCYFTDGREEYRFCDLRTSLESALDRRHMPENYPPAQCDWRRRARESSQNSAERKL